ncbi:MAG: hypothetical protein EPO08_05715 [Rhodospirillaceae bacterium]|nr:MAG: hypothetical protein EPO08_05715 [Rhodospirillaceae bacterium]
MPRSRTCISVIAACCVVLGGSRAEALTVGEFRQAYATAHILDDMTVDQRAAYIPEHHNELELAHAQLESAQLALETLVLMNGLQMQTGRPPFICNYNEEADEIELDKWVDEFRAEALTRFHLEPGPKTDKTLNQVEFDDVLTHKMMENYPCPQPKLHTTAKKTAVGSDTTKSKTP